MKQNRRIAEIEPRHRAAVQRAFRRRLGWRFWAVILAAVPVATVAVQAYSWLVIAPYTGQLGLAHGVFTALASAALGVLLAGSLRRLFPGRWAAAVQDVLPAKCGGCGFDLSGLAAGAACPECGSGR